MTAPNGNHTVVFNSSVLFGEQQQLADSPPITLLYPNDGTLPDPLVGAINPSNDAIITSVEAHDLQSITQFMGPLMAPRFANYQDDIVLLLLHDKRNLDSMDPSVLEFLLQHGKVSNANIVVYAFEWECWDRDKEGIPGRDHPPNVSTICHVPQSIYEQQNDGRSPRGMDILLIELAGVVLNQYDSGSRSLIIDPSSIGNGVLFQSNPFDNMPQYGEELHLFEKAPSLSIGTDEVTATRLKSAYGEAVFTKEFTSQPVISSAIVMGHKAAMIRYIGIMISQYDAIQCQISACNIAYMNALYYSGTFHNNILNVLTFPQGMGVGNDLSGYDNHLSLSKLGILKYDTIFSRQHRWIVYQNDGVTPSPIVYPIGQNEELKEMAQMQSLEYLNEWNEYLNSTFGIHCEELRGTLRGRVLNCPEGNDVRS